MCADVGIVIPAYRPDPERLAAYVTDLHAALAPAHILIELDDPTTATNAALADTAATIHSSPDRRGKGAAISDGFDRLETDVLAFVDADGSTPPASLEAVLAPILADEADVSVGSRRHPDATVRVHQSRVRRRLGDFFVRVARVILPLELYDYQCGAKVISREWWNNVRDHLVSPGFAWDIEFVTIADALGARVHEVPIVWDDMPGSTVGIGGTTSAFSLALIRSWHRAGCIRGHRLHRLLNRVFGSASSGANRPVDSPTEGR